MAPHSVTENTGMYCFIILPCPFRLTDRQGKNLALVVCLLQPALLLIDFGHFQYNGVMLGMLVDFCLLSLVKRS